MACVLRGFLACTVRQVRLGENPCAALAIEKIPHLGTENSVFKIKVAPQIQVSMGLPFIF
jgi:hypothetical protein